MFGGHLHFDDGAVGFGGVGGAEVGVDDVVAFGAPGDVVGVAEGVDLERADVGGEEGEVLCRAGEHVPGVEVEEGHEEIEADGGEGADDEVGEDVVAEGVGGGVGGDGLEAVVFELEDDDEEGGEGGVGHDDGVGDHGGEEHAFGALGAVAHAEDELQADEEDAGVAEDGEDVSADVVAERVDLGIGETAGDEVEG